MVKADTFFDFLGDVINEDACFEITEKHRKVGDVIMLSRCQIKKTD